MKRLAIIGSGDLGQQIAYHALNDNHYQPVCFFDDFSKIGNAINGIRVDGKINDIEKSFNDGKFDVLMIGIGYRHIDLREQLFNRFSETIPFGTIIHSSSFVDKSCKIGTGVFIYPGCILDMNVIISHNVLLNVGCVIAHDTTIGRHSFLSPAVKVAGFVEVGQKVNLGIGSTVIDNIKISDKVRTGGGTVVIKNIELQGLYVGIPAVYKKK